MKSLARGLLLTQIVCIVFAHEIFGQTVKSEKLFRVYADNDFLNIRGKGTDRAYTAGTRFDLYYGLGKKPALLPGIFARKRKGIIYLGEWGLMQMLFTPNDISVPWVQPNDYFYSGALFIIHSLCSYDSTSHSSFQTDYLVGIRGPAAFGKQTQTFVHHAIHYTLPMGWDNQLKNYPIVNVNITLEKQLAYKGRWLEFIAGGKIRAGTLQNGLSIYPVIRIGKMNPYFNGLFSQFSGYKRNYSGGKKGIQAYLIIKPELEIVFSNLLIETGFFEKSPSVKINSAADSRLLTPMDYSLKDIRNLVYSIDYGAVVTAGNFGISFVQNSSTESRKGTYSHEFGNISIYFIL